MVALWAESRGVKVVEPSARHIDRARRKRMGVSYRGLISFRGLDTLLEGPAVCDTAKGARNELRVIHIAEAEEYLIFVAGIEVCPNVERVSILGRLRR